MSEFMNNMLGQTSDGTQSGNLGVIPAEWHSEPTQTQKWLYTVGDSVSPGSYTHIDGYALCDEGSGKLLDGEDPLEAAQSLKDSYLQMDDAVQIAIVTKIVDADGDEIYSEVTQII